MRNKKMIIVSLLLFASMFFIANPIKADQRDIRTSKKFELRYWKPNWTVKSEGNTLYDDDVNFYELKYKSNSKTSFFCVGMMFGDVKSQDRVLDGEDVVGSDEDAVTKFRFDAEIYAGKTYTFESAPIATGIGAGFKWFNSGEIYSAERDQHNSITFLNLFIHVPFYIRLVASENYQIGIGANVNYSPLNYCWGFDQNEFGGHFISAFGELSVRWGSAIAPPHRTA